MSTIDLIRAATPSILRAPWCAKGSEAMSVLVDNGDLAKAAASLDQHAELRNVAVVEVCRVTRGSYEAVYARGEPV